jgi:anti-sigma-K factor RskA
MTDLSEEDIAFAGEYVLGLLDAADEARAAARIATDRDFAAEVEAWRERLQAMFAGDDAEAPAHLYTAIEERLPAATGQDGTEGKLVFWRTLTAISAGAAAMLGILLLQQPEVVAPPVQASAPLIAALGSEDGRASLTASYDAATGRMIVTPVALDTGALYPELWVIPADGVARSLGIVDAKAARSMALPAGMRAYMTEGATLAITPEPEGGAPGGKATGPVIASGKITII